MFELLQRGVDVKSVPQDDDVYDQSERSELIFLSFMISLAEFAPLSVEDGSRQFMAIFTFVELLEYTTTFGFIVYVSERMNYFVDAAQFATACASLVGRSPICNVRMMEVA